VSSLIINNLSCLKGYNQLFSNLSFQVNTGDILRITGTNGSGKTSLLKILAGISSYEQGEVSLNNYQVNTDEYQHNIFYLGHQASLSSELSSIENLEYLSILNKTAKQQELFQALADIGLKGYEYEYCGNLSAGQKRRVILAGLFVSKAQIWLLDDPFTALDPTGVKIVENKITETENKLATTEKEFEEKTRIPIRYVNESKTMKGDYGFKTIIRIAKDEGRDLKIIE
jgi:heme exporter protein A